jgi:hypothetical protein
LNLKVAIILYIPLVVAFLVWAYRKLRLEQHIYEMLEQGVETEAEVVNSGWEPNLRSGRYYVAYRFKPQSMVDNHTQFVSGKQSITWSHYRKLGKIVMIRYLPSDVDISRLAGPDIDHQALSTYRLFVFQFSVVIFVSLILALVLYLGTG